MFADACELVGCFTFPVIISVLYFDMTVNCIVGAFIVLNDEGWIITTAHLLDSYFAFQKHQKEITDHERRVETIQKNQKFSDKEKLKRIAQLETNPKWIIHRSVWWGGDGVKLKEIKVLPEGDILIARIEPFDSKAIKAYPLIKNTKTLRPGTSLCRIGYPFHEVKATYSEKDGFILPPLEGRLPLFPIEGIYTRNIIAGKSKDGKYDIKFLETSSPGLRGQSGGPVFDMKGTVWAVQSTTTFLPLGFSPKVKKNGVEVEENQFLNVGWGIHPELIVAFLRDNDVRFSISDY